MANRGGTNSEQTLPFGGKGKTVVVRVDEHIPQGAVRLTKNQIIQIQHTRVTQWRPQSDVWPFKYGPVLFGASTGFCSVVIHSYFRSRFRLKGIAPLSSLLVTVGLPAFLSPIIDLLTVLPGIYSISACPTCLEIRSGLIQGFMSVVYPSMISSLLSIYYSRETGTHLGRDEFHPGLRHAFKSNIRTRNVAIFMMMANFGLGYFVTYQRGSCLDFIMTKEAEKVSKGEMTTDDL